MGRLTCTGRPVSIMHEMTLAEEVVGIVEETAARAGANRVASIWLDIGALSAVEPEALRFCFDAVARNTVAAGARLEIAVTPGAGWCMACRRTVVLAALYDACPFCGRHQVQPTAGMHMRVTEIEIE